VAIPQSLPIPAVDGIQVLVQTVAVLAVFLVLPSQIALDLRGPRPGSYARLAATLLVATGMIAWIGGILQHGFGLGPLVSLINWIALPALMMCGQVLFANRQRLDKLLTFWAMTWAVVSAPLLVFIFVKFGGQIFVDTDRGPFQVAVRAIFPTWPNYYAVTVTIAIAVLYSRAINRRGTTSTWLALGILMLTLILTFSRTAWVAGMVSLLVMTVASGRARKASLVLIVSLCFLLLIASRVPAVRYQFIATFTSGTSQQKGLFERYAYMLEALRLWRESPLVGIGYFRFDQFADVARIAQVAGFNAISLGSVHNEYVTTLLKGGIIGFSGFIAFLVVATHIFLRSIKIPDTRDWAVVGLGITTILVLGGFAMESFRTLSVSAPYWLLVGAVSVMSRLPLNRSAVADSAPALSGALPSNG
jgi:O-antigen ligase